MWPYVVFFVLILSGAVFPQVFFANNARIRKILSTAIPILVLFLFSALKDTSVGRDTAVYSRTYIECLSGQHTFSELTGSFDYGVSALMILFSSLGLNYYLLQAFLYVLVYLPLYFFCLKFCKNPSLSLLVYSCIWMLTFNFSGIRQAIATSFVVGAYGLISKKRVTYIIPGFFLIALAFCFHSSALIAVAGLPLLFSGDTKGLWKYVLVVIAASYFIVPVAYQAIYFLTSSNEYGPITQYGVGEYYLLYFFIFLFGFLVETGKARMPASLNSVLGKASTKFEILDRCVVCEETLKESGLFLCFSLAAAIEAVATVSTTINRFGIYFLPFGTLLLPNYIERINNRVLRYALIAVLVLGSLFLFWYSNLRPNYLSCNPYRFLWE